MIVDILTYCLGYIYSQKHFLDGLVKKLEELEKTAELYKGNLFFAVAELNSLTASNSPACNATSK